MKKNVLKTIVLAILAIAFTSCSTMKINYYGKKIENVQSITLVSTMIGKFQQPIFPLLDAGMFNEKTIKIADRIMDIQQKNIDKYRDIVAGSLKTNFKCKVIYGDSLQNTDGFESLKSSSNFKNNLRTENDHFPYIITAKNDINPFRFEKGDVVKYFATPENYKSAIAKIGEKTNTEYIAVSYTTLAVGGVGYFGIYGYLMLDTYIYIFNKNGDLVADGRTWSKPTSIGGKEVEEYQPEFGITTC